MVPRPRKSELHRDQHGRSLGNELRGARLGYRWLDELRVYLRISDTLDGNGFRCELAPPGQIPSTRGPARDPSFRCWWETPDDVDDVRPALAELLRRTIAGDLPAPKLRNYLVLEYDDDGTLRTALPR